MKRAQSKNFLLYLSLRTTNSNDWVSSVRPENSFMKHYGYHDGEQIYQNIDLHQHKKTNFSVVEED